MDDTAGRTESGRGSEEKNPSSLKPDKDQGTQQPAILTSSNNDEGENLKEKRLSNVGLSEEFFLSDLSGD
ncbi:MAG: hypothetical protein JRD69_02820 [Deltaproteobacteria bacterium]|nr:hypothetical protein [Deltaproteobacteria bacterium]